VHRFRWIALVVGRLDRPGIGLALDADHALPVELEARGQRRRWQKRSVDFAMPARSDLGLKRLLAADHRAKRRQQAIERTPLGLEPVEDLDERLDGRQAVACRLTANPIFTRIARRESHTRQRRDSRVELEELAGLPPGAVENDEIDRPIGGQLGDGDSAGTGEDDIGAVGHQRLHQRIGGKVETDAQH